MTALPAPEGSVWPIHVISLARETERRAVCSALLARLGLRFAFVDAIEGEQLSQAEIDAYYDPEKNKRLFKRPLSTPEIGCYVSHYKLWRRIAEGDAPGAVVLEDDFLADESLPHLLGEICRLDLTGRMVKLDSAKRSSGRALVELGTGHWLIDPRRVPGHTLGYVLPRDTARKLAEGAAPFGRPVDMDLKHWWELGISILMVSPPPLRHPPEEPRSAIDALRRASKPNGEMGLAIRFLRNIRYQIPYRLGMFRARLRRKTDAPTKT